MDCQLIAGSPWDENDNLNLKMKCKLIPYALHIPKQV